MYNFHDSLLISYLVPLNESFFLFLACHRVYTWCNPQPVGSLHADGLQWHSVILDLDENKVESGYFLVDDRCFPRNILPPVPQD